ncbi:cyclic AMP-dependent transcription factor ATF-6 alpha isoform X2 [Chrysoperla carnea]|uniref:cyclic AMP-dependent transcription factor ATF-6 alpha isoform X2 n=1 Tax=Chrysoperla carnea TaxID=189513 RepID=UPI001D0665E9|nr:cyclic AMP-dependent transcription factor ATF-6 alpha isoform X2 [Chrysoperla carnea]
MPTDFEIDDFGNEKTTYDVFNCDDFLKDNLDMDYVYDEELFQKITNEIEIPLFDSDNILLRDATPNEIWSEATQFQNPSETYNNLTCHNNIQSTVPTESNGTATYSIETSSTHENDTNSINSHSPTPSLSGSDSCSINDPNLSYNVINLETPPISPPRNTNTNQPILINSNGELYRMISFEPTTDLDNTTFSTNTIHTQSIKIPINTSRPKTQMKNNVKRSVLFPKSSPTTKPLLNNTSANDVQLFTTTPVNHQSPIVMNVDGSEVDPRMFKRMQRMIKNRESASMSRKRKKDYVVSLEKRCEQLSTENKKLRMENNSLKQIVAGFQMNCKSTVLSFNNISSKNTAILLGMLLMVSINIGSFRNLLFRDISNEDLTPNPSIDIDLNDFHTRHLLNIADIPNPNGLGLGLTNEENPTKNDLKLQKPTYTNTSCPLSVNQTESIRLASELRKFIGDPFYNITHIYQRRNLKSRLNLRDYEFKRSKRYANEHQIKAKLNKLYSLSRRNRRIAAGTEDMQIYSFGPHLDYTRFFDRINLRDDTFYVISLRGDHMLIPAMNHNKTSRPKMSLLMPALSESFSTPNNHITLVKIDCEVLNTNLVHVNQNSIPQHLRASFQNQTQTYNLNTSTPSTTANITITRKPKRNRLYKPYFIRTTDDDLDLKSFGPFP